MTAFDNYFKAVATPTLMSQFGDQYSVLPAGGGETYTITAMPDENVSLDDAEYGYGNRSVLALVIQRDPDSAYGAILDPQLGLGVQKVGDDRVFSWTGQKQNVTTDSWTLVFAYDQPVRHGQQQRR